MRVFSEPGAVSHAVNQSGPDTVSHRILASLQVCQARLPEAGWYCYG